jgi:hypothetical protein
MLLYEYLMEKLDDKAGISMFAENRVKTRCIMGNDYYVTNEHLGYPNGRSHASGEVFGYYVETNIKMLFCRW